MSVRQAELARRWGLTRTRISQYVREGMTLESVEASAAWRLARYGKAEPAGVTDDSLTDTAHSQIEKKGAPAASELERADLDGVLARAIDSELEAYREWKAANGSKLRKERQRIYQQAATTRIQVEKQIAEARVATGELLTMDQVRRVISEAHEPLRAMLEAMPAALAQRVNPAEPEHARVVLDGEVGRILGRLSG